MNIILLTHQRELSKKTNTGGLVVDALGNSARKIVWERTKPDRELMALINERSVALLYPSEESELISEKCCSSNSFKNYVVIDGTWQEARKIYNKSPYLHDLPTVKVETSAASIYTLRRNQKESGLCTAECVVEVLKAEGFEELAENLQGRLLDFLSNKD